MNKQNIISKWSFVCCKEKRGFVCYIVVRPRNEQLWNEGNTLLSTLIFERTVLIAYIVI